MSKASFEHLQKKFADVPQARIVYVTDGNAPLKESGPRATRRRDLRVCC
jgi:hypothetical protein